MPIPKMLAHAEDRTLCSCNTSIDSLGDYVFTGTCKKHKGSNRCHNLLMDELANLARASKMRPARVNHKGSSCATGGWNNSEHHTHDVRRARANVKTNKYSDTYGHKAFAPAITGMSGKVHVHFMRLLWFLADKQEDKIGNEAFRWTMAKDCNSDKTSIGSAIVFCCTTRCNLSVHSLADPHSGSGGYSRAGCARPGECERQGHR